jgi:putative endopeptidase
LGTGAQRIPNWKAVLEIVSTSLKDPVSKLYVDTYFPKESKTQVAEMVQHILESCKEVIKQASWMEAKTKEKALEKVANTIVEVGYPDQWRDFSPLVSKISRTNSYLTNIRNADTFAFKIENLDLLGKLFDKKNGDVMGSYEVNAMTRNDAYLFFPAVNFSLMLGYSAATIFLPTYGY